VKFN
jgi:hypothetical protein